MIPRSHVIAPSQNTLHYLRKILCHWPCELPASHCTQLGRRRKSNCIDTHVNSLNTRPKCRGYNTPNILPNDTPAPIAPRCVWYPFPKIYKRKKKAKVNRKPAAESKVSLDEAESRVCKSVAEPEAILDEAESKAWDSQCQRLVSKGELSEATKEFLEGLDRGEKGEHIKTTGKSLMTALASKGRHSEIPRIFHLMALKDRQNVDAAALNRCLEAHLHRGMYWRVKATWEHHRRRVEPDPATARVLLRNLVFMREWSKAEGLVRNLLGKELPSNASRDLFAVLLGGLRITSGSFMKMERIYKILSSKVEPPISVFNILIEAAISAGRLDIAKGYALEKLARGVKHNRGTFGIFLAAYTRAGDWERTENVLRRMEAQNMEPTTPMFNMLLKAYSQVVGLGDLENFFERMVARGVLPDSISFNIMIHLYAKKWDEANIALWVRRMKDAGIEPDAVTVNTLFQVIRMTGEALPSMLRRIYGAISDKDGSLVNIRTKGMLLHSAYKGTERLRVRPYLPMVDQTEEESAMETAIREGQPEVAINIFRKALSKGVKPSLPLVTSAVRATAILPSGQREDPHRLLRTSQERGVKISKIPILNAFPISMPHPDANTSEAFMMVSKQVRQAYEFLEAAGVPITHDISIDSASRMINEGHSQAAVLFLHEISKTYWGRASSWGKKSLTVLLKGYIQAKDISGIGWIVEQMTQGEEVADRRFFRYLKLANGVVRNEDEKKYLHWLEVRCSKHCRERRAEAKRRMRFLWSLVKGWGKA